MLKHKNKAEIMKTWFSMKFQNRKYFFQELKCEHRSFADSSVINLNTPEV